MQVAICLQPQTIDIQDRITVPDANRRLVVQLELQIKFVVFLPGLTQASLERRLLVLLISDRQMRARCISVI